MTDGHDSGVAFKRYREFGNRPKNVDRAVEIAMPTLHRADSYPKLDIVSCHRISLILVCPTRGDGETKIGFNK
jgi:hypothetical protein